METTPVSGGHPSGERPTEGCPAHAPGRSTVIRYFGDYVLLGQIAQGGMGVVYRGRQVSLNRPVAVKMIRTDRPPTSAEIQRFRTEAEAVASLDHPHIVPIYEVGEHEGQPYFSMRLVEGYDLAHAIGGKPMPPKCAAQILAAVARAVHHAHERGVLHRDLKPSNILLEQADSEHLTPFITDFGLAKFTERGRDMSASGAVLGTIEYMAPEQAAGKIRQPTIAADIYSLGAILFAMLTGRAPFKHEIDEGDLALLKRVSETEPPRPRSLNPACDRDLETICLKCLEKEPGRRYGSATEMAEELERWARGEPILARSVSGWERVVKWYRRKPVVASLATAVVVVFLVAFCTTILLWRQTIRGRNEARASLQLVQIQRSEELFSKDRAAEALAYLADLLQNGPPNRVAAERLLSALTQRAWCRPLIGLRDSGEVVSRASFSPDGLRVATASSDKTARVWDACTGQPLTEPMRHQTLVISASFSPDGQRVVTGQRTISKGYKNVRVWDVRNGQPLTEPLQLRGPDWSASFSPDGQRLVTASADGAARLWDACTGLPLTEPMQHENIIWHPSFSSNAQRLLTASDYMTVMVDFGRGVGNMLESIRTFGYRRVPGMTSTGTAAPQASGACFVSTRWTVVLSAGDPGSPHAATALEALCRAYWYPLYAFVRRRGHSPPDAQDLTQEFFAQLLEHNWVARADRHKGRFRSFLLMAMKRFLANEWDKARTLKRGGQVRLVPLPLDTAETRYSQEPADTSTPEQVFEKQWALALLDSVLNRLRDEYAQDGKAVLFDALKPCLIGRRETQPYAALATGLGMTEGAVKVAVCRLRERYRERLKGEIAQTVAFPADVDEELRHLFRVLARG